MKLLIRDAILDGAVVTLGIDDGVISVVMPGTEDGGTAPEGGPGQASTSGGHAGYLQGLPAGWERADRVIDASGLYAFPGLRNGHTHAAMTLFRGWGDDLPLMEWLQGHIWPAEARMTADDIYAGTRLAALEMIRSGTTYFNDMYWHADTVARAAEEAGLRAHVGSVFIDHGDEDTAAKWRDDVLRRVEERDRFGPRIRTAIAPHAVYTVSPENLEWLGGVAREHDLVLHIHLSETQGEVDDCLTEHGVRPTMLLERTGLLGPNLVAAHGVYLDGEELELLGEAGAALVHNPAANLKLAVGAVFDYDAARAAGVNVVIGTDGPGSNNNLDLLEELKIAALIQKHRARRATALPATEALAMATENAARAFGVGSGRIEEGAPADLILVDLSGPGTQPVHDAISNLVYAAHGSAVHTTICDGRVLMHRGEVETLDEEEVIREAGKAARSLVARVNGG